MSKIKKIVLSGYRGVKETLVLDLGTRSLLLYGENGFGKSSLTDAIEWFFTGKVAHLKGEEVSPSKSGKEALRNVLIDNATPSAVELTFKDSELDCTKSIDSSLLVVDSNIGEEFSTYIKESETEQLILRHQDLLAFVGVGKTDKLTQLQKIIGFEEVAELRSLLKKVAGSYKKRIQTAAYSDKKSAQQAILIDCFGQNVVEVKDFASAVSDLIAPLGLNVIVNSLKDADGLLTSLQGSEDQSRIEEIASHNKVADYLSAFNVYIDQADELYRNFFNRYSDLQKDAEKLKNLQLLSLLTEAHRVLQINVFKEGFCPVCEQKTDDVALLSKLVERIEDLNDLKDEQKQLAEAKATLKDLVRTLTAELKALLTEKALTVEMGFKSKEAIDQILRKVLAYDVEIEKEIHGKESLRSPEEMLIDRLSLKKLESGERDYAKGLLDEKGNLKIQIAVKLTRGIEAYSNYSRLAKEEEILTIQKETLDALYANFIGRQESALTGFLELFSEKINKYFGVMNPGTRVENIRLEPIKKKSGDELEGITIAFKFFGKDRKPPASVLSESYVNSLGIAFFLASVQAFNKTNKFFLLDDVISSFDSRHRLRFIRLLLEEFGDYQILLLTHEDNFFSLASSDVKKKNWNVHSLDWTDTNGTILSGAATSLLESIEDRIKNRNVTGLGNDIRIYAEQQLKIIANNTETKLAFRYNSINEDRMLNELFNGIIASTNKHSKSDLKGNESLTRVLGSPLLLANKTSHDSFLNAKFEDLEVFWEDISKFLEVFKCQKPTCGQFVAMKYFDTVNTKIRCGCGSKEIEWTR